MKAIAILTKLCLFTAFAYTSFLSATGAPVNTGINTGSSTIGGTTYAIDNSWSITAQPVLEQTPPIPTYPAFLVTPPSVYLANNGVSQWIGPIDNAVTIPPTGGSGLTSGAIGIFSFQTTFGAASSVSLRFAVDNLVDNVVLNGVAMNVQGPPNIVDVNTQFMMWNYLTLTAANGLNASGSNVLVFNENNVPLDPSNPNYNPATGNPTALRVEFTNVVTSPEPGFYMLLASLLAIVMVLKNGRIVKVR